ncbi:hypothetical protein DIS24_g40 [Lasiodiplodia hormozganensis]|uniref:USP domain-containing protein n=1 Tax=Lasiodiplodia hormozganensis TaxID=869390 RepID=A0AA39Z6Z7_9PEZI|nr:hypothetical protein DIS24_g40 [Lasiodiplodia hormozganensis]
MAAKATSAQRTAAQTTTGQRATTPGLRRNLTNLKGTCYVSTVAQVLHGIPHVRTFAKSPINFRFVQKEDSRGLVEALRDIFQKLDEGGRKLPPAVTQNLLGKISSLGNDYATEAHDAKELFEQLLDMLVGTSSVTSAGGESARPLEQLAAELECTQRPLKDDAKRSWSGFTHNGRETLLAETLYHQIVRERVCTSCGFIDRLFQQLATVTIESPDGILSPAGKRYDLNELFRDYVLDTAAEEVTDRVSRCPVTTCKSALGPQTRRIVKTPQVLSFTFRRALQDFSGQEQKWLNHVEVPERLNLAEYVDDVSLLSERKQSVPGSTPTRWVTDEITDYVLQATIHYRPTGAHYVAYVRHDDKWIRFDDIEETPDECSPWDGIRETPDEAVYVAVYLKSQPPPPLKAPAQTGEKHPRPGTSGSTAAERNQRQGVPPTGSPLISGSRPRATTPAGEPPQTKTKAKESSDNTLLRKIRAQIMPGGLFEKPIEQLRGDVVDTKQLQSDVAEIKKQTKQLVAEMTEVKACIMKLPTEPIQMQNESSQFGQLKEAIARIEKHLLQSANAREDERRARQEIAAEEAKIAAAKAKIADIEAKLANSRK